MLIRVGAALSKQVPMPALSPKDKANMMLIRKMKEGGGGAWMLCPGIMKDRSVSHVPKWTCQLKGYYPCGHFINLIEKVGGNRD